MQETREREGTGGSEDLLADDLCPVAALAVRPEVGQGTAKTEAVVLVAATWLVLVPDEVSHQIQWTHPGEGSLSAIVSPRGPPVVSA